MKQVNGYLTFDGNCREAMAFYQECFGGELSLLTVGESPIADQWPGELQQTVLHARLTHGGLMLMASDCGPMGSQAVQDALPIPSVSLMVECESQMEIEHFFALLSAEGKIQCPLGTQFWGATFGALTDRYGINWLLNHEKVTL